MNFSKLIGEIVFIKINLRINEENINLTSSALVEITGIESGGIWVVNDKLYEDIVDEFPNAEAPPKLWPWLENEVEIFIPYHSIVFAIHRGQEKDARNKDIEGINK